MYPNDIPASKCDGDQSPDAFEKFRMVVIAGGSSKYVTVAHPDSIEARLNKLVVYLNQKRPREQWGQFLSEDGKLKWESIAVGRLSQGGGHAALIAIKHRVARVVCAGSPKDYSKALRRPAEWYSLDSATPKACFFSFYHLQDYQGCTPEQQMKNLRALKLDQFGAPADVDVDTFPYHHARILTTDYPGTKLVSMDAHSSVIANKRADVFSNVWNYMLTEPVPVP